MCCSVSSFCCSLSITTNSPPLSETEKWYFSLFSSNDLWPNAWSCDRLYLILLRWISWRMNLLRFFKSSSVSGLSFGGGAAKGLFISAPGWRICWVLVIHVCTFSRRCDQRSLYAQEAIFTRTESKSVSFMTGVRAKFGPSDKTENASSDRLTWIAVTRSESDSTTEAECSALWHSSEIDGEDLRTSQLYLFCNLSFSVWFIRRLLSSNIIRSLENWSLLMHCFKLVLVCTS